MPLSQAWSLLIISLAAAVLPGLSAMVGLPAVVMEILFGVILGKSLLQLHFEGQWLPFLAELGFLLLMFQAGMEINFSMLRKQNKSQLLLQIGIFGATFSCAFVGSMLLGHGVFLALVLSTTSLGLVVPVLKELNYTKTHLGQSVLIAATLADFLTLLGITFAVLWHKEGIGWHFLRPLPLFLGFGLLLKAGRLWAWWHPETSQRLLAPEDAQEIGVRLAMCLLFLLVALSELAHLEPVLGAFLGGVVLAFVFREKTHLESKLSGIGFGFLVPLFFINVGMELDVRSLLSWKAITFEIKLLAIAVTVKLLPSLLFTLNKIPLRTSLRVGLLLSSRLSLIIAAAAIGLEEGFLTAELKDEIVLLAVLSCLIFPTLFKRWSPPVPTNK